MRLEKPTQPLLCSPALQPSSALCFPSLWWLGIIVAKQGGTRWRQAGGRGATPSSLTPCLSHSLANIPLTPETQRDQERRIRREIANSNERRRMQSINAGFQSLKTLIPHTDGEKLSKVSRTSPGLQQCGMQMPVLHAEVFGVTFWQDGAVRIIGDICICYFSDGGLFWGGCSGGVGVHRKPDVLERAGCV